MRGLFVVAAVLALAGARASAAPAEMLANPGFEETQAGKAVRWEAYGRGYTLDEGVRHGGARSIRCVNRTAEEASGAAYTLELDQKTPAPIVVGGWSRAENVEGGPGADYSLYVDLQYTDGTPLYGQTATFSTGTHDWQRKRVLIVPAKPIRRASIYALFRKHSGTVWFDDISAVSLGGAGFFDSQPVAPPTLAAGARSGWFVRDVAADSPLRALADASSLGIRATQSLSGDISTLSVADTRGKPRAVTLYYVERFAPRDAVWWLDIRSSSPAGPAGERANLNRIGAGATGLLSAYPFACVTAGARGRAIGVTPDLGPVVFRLAYNAPAGLLYAAFDVALDPANLTNNDGKGHGTARVRVARYDVDAAWGFRSAAEGYYRRFPEAFARRTKAEGLWIPFTAPSKVPGVEDFGIAFHEGDNDVAGDDKLGVLSFRYTEPMTWWMSMATSVPRTYDAAMEQVRRQAAEPSGEARQWAQAVLNSGSQAEDGRFNVEFQNAPWTNGAVWNLNPNPRLPHAADQWTKGRLSYTPEYADRTYGPGAKAVQDGEYLDSLEGWAETYDYRPESLRYSSAPPTFSTDTQRPLVQTWMSAYELARYLSEDLHRRGKLLMANSTPWRIWAYAALLDLMGTETNWLPGGIWRPDDDAIMNYRRTLCYRKPYLLLQNTDFEKFGHAEVERYFQRSMFYAIFPSMFSVDASNHPYWEEPRWYDRDRDLFKRYIPLIKRLSAAGWEPVTYARSSDARVYLERYGAEYIAVLNSGREATQATLTLELGRFRKDKPGASLAVVDALTGERVASLPTTGARTLSLALAAEQCRVLRLQAP